MELSTLISPSRCRNRIQGGSKKRVLELAARLIAADYPALDADELFRQLIARERLGSTGIGNGIAIPHCRVENCANAVGGIITLEEAVDFEAVDDAPVDIVFVLLVPNEAQEQHLQILAALAQAFGQSENLQQLRAAESDQALYDRTVAVFSTVK
ncbi:PTS sugar transporter subunit IIA [Gilvimarinus sp. F26214L]|uniref:PTS sugar transporter subunit IIA n=1 Tax=Gilvimarinus sp. DZF01 TaxID=3461371 RepID=UPI0040466F30